MGDAQQTRHPLAHCSETPLLFFTKHMKAHTKSKFAVMRHNPLLQPTPASVRG
jgi:hypothetical protein